MKYPKALDNLTKEFAKLPAIGPRSARRISFFLLTKPKKFVDSLGEAVLHLQDNIFICPICFCLKEEYKCFYCDNFGRDHKNICVVEERENVFVIEDSSVFNGLYHVLEGFLSPLDGVDPDKLRIKELSQRIKENQIEELIIATNPTVEGEVTATYLADLFKESKLKITRLACGLPFGGDIKYSNKATLIKAFEGRMKYNVNN